MSLNKVILMGRLTRNPEIRYSQGEKPVCIARYTLAVDRRFRREGEQEADFIGCVAFGRQGEFAEKYLQKGTKIVICGRIQTGSYTDKEGKTRYTTDIVVEEQSFAESKAASQQHTGQQPAQPQAGTLARPMPQCHHSRMGMHSSQRRRRLDTQIRLMRQCRHSRILTHSSRLETLIQPRSSLMGSSRFQTGS